MGLIFIIEEVAINHLINQSFNPSINQLSIAQFIVVCFCILNILGIFCSTFSLERGIILSVAYRLIDLFRFALWLWARKFAIRSFFNCFNSNQIVCKRRCFSIICFLLLWPSHHWTTQHYRKFCPLKKYMAYCLNLKTTDIFKD